MDENENQRRGAPRKPKFQRVMKNQLWKWQWERIGKDADSRGLSKAQMLRQIVSDWYTIHDSASTRINYKPSREEDLEHEVIVNSNKGE